jgi:hypothetical protein
MASICCTQRVWDDSTGECVRLLAGHTHEVTSLYHDGDTLVRYGVAVTTPSCRMGTRDWDCFHVIRSGLGLLRAPLSAGICTAVSSTCTRVL